MKRIASDIMAKLRTRSTGVGSGAGEIPVDMEAIAGSGAATIAEDAISKRAYELWLERGCPEGSPEQDWYLAESELRGQSEVHS
jgi:hypothetical protein